MYRDQGGLSLSRRILFEKVLEFFGDAVVALRSFDIDSIFLFKHDSGSMLKLAEVQKKDDDSVSNAITVIASQIRMYEEGKDKLLAVFWQEKGR